MNIETSTRVCSVALAEDGNILESREKTDTFEHAKILHPFIREVMKGQQWSKLDAIAVSEGPGSYTGLRIGVSAAKGLCYAENIPLIAVSTLQAMAMHAIDQLNDEQAFYVPMIDARRMEVYSAVYDVKGNPHKKVEAEIIDHNSFKECYARARVYYFGDGAAKCREAFSDQKNMIYHNGGFPSAEYMNKLAQRLLEKKDFRDVAYFEPFYLKDFIAGKPKVKGLEIK